METPKNNQTENNEQVVGLTVIEQALEKENITRQILDKLKSEYSGLKIASIDDTDGFNKVEEARKHCKRLRGDATRICKKGREDAIKIQSDWIAKEKEVVGEIEEVENALKAEAQRIKDEKERILFEAAQREKLPARKEKLLTIGIEVEDEQLLKIGDFDFEKLYQEFYVKHLEEVAAKAKAEAEAKAAEEKRLAEEAAEKKRVEDKIKKDLFEKRQQEINPIAKYFDESTANGVFLTLETTEEEFQFLIKHCTENKELFEKEKAEAAERERLAKEAAAKAEAELKEQQRIAAEEKERQDKIIEQQRLENERLSKEAAAKAEAEEKAKAEAEEKERQRVEAERKAALAPDKEKLKVYIETFTKVKVEFELTSDSSKSVMENIDEKFKNFIKWAYTEIEKI